MSAPYPEILLLNISFSAQLKKGVGFRSFAGRYIPLGMHCLSSIAEDRIRVIDVTALPQLNDLFETFAPGQIRVVIFRIIENNYEEMAFEICRKLREIFPKSRIGCCKNSYDENSGLDFTVFGTGKTLLLRILRGECPKGFYDTFVEDMATPLSVPVETINYLDVNIEPEKWIKGNTIEVFQPWLGLLEQSSEVYTYPGAEWMSEMVLWLQKAGFTSFHFRPSGLNSGDLHEFRSIMLNLKASFAVSFRVKKNTVFSAIGLPLKQIWLYFPDVSLSQETIIQLRQIKESNCLAGLCLNKEYIHLSESAELLTLADRIVIEDQNEWPFEELRRVTAKFWGFRKRFFKRLLAVKSAAELIVFMKISYMILEILFSSEKNGRCK